ncbi:MAG: hypothetical protein JWN86_3585 [Planctomycetota bacterium]|nr:hypothetical protein [Planctomycetota bacterium]
MLLLCRRHRAARNAEWVATVLGLSTCALVAFGEIPYRLLAYYHCHASFLALMVGPGPCPARYRRS